MEQDNKFDLLPNEMLFHIFSFFNKRDHGRAWSVSKHFHKVSKYPLLKNLPYPELDYSRIFPEKSKSLVVNLSAGCNEGIWSIAVLSNRHFITATYDGLLKVWDSDKAVPIRQFNKHAQHQFKMIRKIIPISVTAFISCGDNGTIYLWDIDQKNIKDQDKEFWDEPLIEFRGHLAVDTVHDVEFLKESNLLITGCSDKTLRIWNIQTGECLHTLSGHTQAVSYIATFPNDLIVSASHATSHGPDINICDPHIRIWNPYTKSTSLATLRGHTKRITAFCKLNDELLATGSEDGTLRIWNIKERTCIKIINLPELKQPECLKVITPGYLACGTLVDEADEDCIYLYDIKDYNFPLVKSFTGHTYGLIEQNSLLDLENGYFASTGCFDSDIKLWHVEKDGCLQTLESSGDIRELTKLPNGYVISGCKSGLNIWAFPERECNLYPHINLKN